MEINIEPVSLTNPLYTDVLKNYKHSVTSEMDLAYNVDQIATNYNTKDPKRIAEILDKMQDSGKKQIIIEPNRWYIYLIIVIIVIVSLVLLPITIAIIGVVSVIMAYNYYKSDSEVE